ncbi:histidine kinase [Rugosimonospora africana]|uniref:histidine kinase n=2 Tax=Rugosimonospora africana TaxID=556532 RepID=A0A8J3QLK5_9ACTN|nr:histidine kinase [Rugosimonospora africana]
MLRQIGADSAYAIVGFPIALAGFIVTLPLFVLGVGTLITVVGFPIMVGALYAARGFADLERLRLPTVTHRPAPRPAYRSAPPGSGFWRRIFTPLRDGQSWLDLMHAIFGWILYTVSFVFTVTWWAGALGGLSAIIWTQYIPHGDTDQDLNELLHISDTLTARIGLNTVIGLFFLVTLPLVVRVAALVPAQFGRALLTGIAEVQNRISGLEQQRDSAVSAEATALRRLERDIHDGPQQRLVRLAMDLGRARQQMNSNPDAARATIDEALGQTRETLDELRALSRGIAPPILSDRGLPSALAALASRSTVPVALTVPPKLGRLTPILENTAYFLVAESLTNLAKHSQATNGAVYVSHANGRLIVAVLDDGVGGAHLSKGHGLTGLADRVRAAGGTLTVVSPEGGPTEIRAELPCE